MRESCHIRGSATIEVVSRAGTVPIEVGLETPKSVVPTTCTAMASTSASISAEVLYGLEVPCPGGICIYSVRRLGGRGIATATETLRVIRLLGQAAMREIRGEAPSNEDVIQSIEIGILNFCLVKRARPKPWRCFAFCASYGHFDK